MASSTDDFRDERRWAYLAGFTDGDGHITWCHPDEAVRRPLRPGRYSPEVKYAIVGWCQRADASEVLGWIADFLRAQGICLKQHPYSVATAGHEYPQQRLDVQARDDVRHVLTRLVPFLVLKQSRALQALAALDAVDRLRDLYGPTQFLRRHRDQLGAGYVV